MPRLQHPMLVASLLLACTTRAFAALDQQPAQPHSGTVTAAPATDQDLGEAPVVPLPGSSPLVAPRSTAAPDPVNHAQPHNLIFFVPDGLRASSVTMQDAPTFAEIRRDGVDFSNTHAVYPTLTTPNAAAFATGHGPGDSGDFANTVYSGAEPLPTSRSLTPFLEDDGILKDLDDRFEGNYLGAETVLAAARTAGFSTAAIGKIGPTSISDVTSRDGLGTVVIDDATGSSRGIPLEPEMLTALAREGVATHAPSRGANGQSGDVASPGTHVANIDQETYFTDATTRVILPMFKKSGKPFAVVFWSRDPDGTQHNQGDSFNKLVPGINGRTSLAAIKNADTALAKIRAAVKALGLEGTTDIVVAADHGFSTISKQSETSFSTTLGSHLTPIGELPPGFVAVDIAHALHLPIFDADQPATPLDFAYAQVPAHGNALIGHDAAHPDVIVAANGGSDLLYLTSSRAKTLLPTIVTTLLGQDYTSGVFVDDAYGSFPGTLHLSDVGLTGNARTPKPTIAVNFRSYATACAVPVHCSVEIADTPLQEGQGMHGGLNRADTKNFVAAIGPDFRSHFIDGAPIGNADVGLTLAHILGLRLPLHGERYGRVIDEALDRSTLGHVVQSHTSVSKASGKASPKPATKNASHDSKLIASAGTGAGKHTSLALKSTKVESSTTAAATAPSTSEEMKKPDAVVFTEYAPIPSVAVVRSAPAKNGYVTVLREERYGRNVYFEAAGVPGRTLGL